MQLEEFIDKIGAEGYRVNNLFQLQSGLWQANLVRALSNEYWQFGTGTTAKEALTNCYQRAKVELAEIKPPQSLYLRYVVNAAQGKKSSAIKLEDL